MHATGVQIHDRETGKDYGLCDSHAEQWQRDYPEEFSTGLGGTALGRLVVIGPLFLAADQWECPACRAESAG